MRLRLALLAFLVMVPGTLCAPVLREFVSDIFPVGPDGAAWFLSVGMLGSILAAPAVGRLADASGRRMPFLIGGALTNALCWAIVPYAPNFTVALAIRLIEGVASIAVIGPLLVLVAEVGREGLWSSDLHLRAQDHSGAVRGTRGEDNRHGTGESSAAMAFGWVAMSMMLGVGTGLALGGIVGGYWLYAPFWLAALWMLVNALLFRRMLPADDMKAGRPRTNAAAAAGVPEGEVVNQDASGEPAPGRPSVLTLGLPALVLLALPIGLAFADRFATGYTMTSLNFRMREELLMSPSAAGGVLGLIMLSMSLLSPLSARLLRDRRGAFPAVLVVAAGSILFGLGLIATGFSNTATTMTLAALLTGLGAGLMHAPTMILNARLAPPALRATMMTVYVAAGSLGNLVGPLAARFFETRLAEFAASIGRSEWAFTMVSFSFGGLEIVLAMGLLIGAWAWLRDEGAGKVDVSRVKSGHPDVA